MRAADIIAAALAKLERFTMAKKLYNPLTDEYDGVPAEELAFNGGQRSGKALMLIQEKAMAQKRREQMDFEHSQQYYEQFYRQQGAMMQQQQQAQNSLAQLQGAYGNIGQRQSNNWGLGQYATDLTPVQRFDQSGYLNVFERAPQSSFIEETKKTETPEAWLRRRVGEVLWKGDKAA